MPIDVSNRSMRQLRKVAWRHDALAAGKTLGIPRKGLDSQRPRQEYEGVALVHQHSAQEPLFQTATAALSRCGTPAQQQAL